MEALREGWNQAFRGDIAPRYQLISGPEQIKGCGRALRHTLEHAKQNRAFGTVWGCTVLLFINSPMRKLFLQSTVLSAAACFALSVAKARTDDGRRLTLAKARKAPFKPLKHLWNVLKFPNLSLYTALPWLALTPLFAKRWPASYTAFGFTVWSGATVGEYLGGVRVAEPPEIPLK